MSAKDCDTCDNTEWCVIEVHGTPGRCCTMCLHRDKSVKQEPCSVCRADAKGHTEFVHRDTKQPEEL